MESRLRADLKRWGPYVVFASVGVLYLIPLLLSGRPYVDDLRRSLTGVTGWVPNGRPLSDLVMVLFNIGYPMADLAPLTQIAGVCIILVACVLTFLWTSALSMPPIWRALACCALLLNPFLLQNMAYRFDALPMAVAFLSCVWAAAPRNDRSWLAMLKCAGFVLIGLCIYQAAANVTVALTLLLLAIDALGSDPVRSVWTRLWTRLAGFVLAAGVYALFIGPLFAAGTYTLAHSDRVPLTWDGLSKVFENFARATAMIWTSFDAYQLVFLAGLAVVGLAGFVGLLLQRVDADGTRWALAITAFGSVPLLWLTPLGLSGALQSPVWEPRVLMAFGIVLAFALLFAVEGLMRLRTFGFARHLRVPVLVIAVVMPLFVCISAAYAFGSAQARQDAFDQSTIASLRVGFAQLGVTREYVFAVEGQQPFAAAAATTIGRYPLLRRMVPIYLKGRSYWATTFLRYHGLDVTYDPGQADTATAETVGKPPDYRGSGFDLTLSGKAVVLRFR